MSKRKRDALTQLIQVFACADRALQREVFCEPLHDLERDLAGQERVESGRNALSDGSSEGLLLGVVHPSLRHQ